MLELVEILKGADGNELIRTMLGRFLQELSDAEPTAHIGAGMHERSQARTTQRNDTRDKLLTTAAGDLTVRGT